MKTYTKCQSCGMPLKRDVKGGGINVDGTKSLIYCSYCYHNGQFTMPTCTLEEMQNLVKGKLKEMRFPGFVASFHVRSLRKLERWSKNR